jgi:plastocyanin
MAAKTGPVLSRRGMLLAAFGSIVALAVSACNATPVVENPAGYPPIPRGRSAAPAPTPGGTVPTVVGVDQSPVASKEGSPQEEGGGLGAVGPASGSAGIYPAMGGAGSARAEPKPAASPTPQPIATVTISRERGFEPAQLTINRGDAVLWQNNGRTPQTVSGDPGLATDRGLVVLPPGAEPWTSPVLNNGSSYIHAFNVSGEYAYVSTTLEQQGTVGRITVR